MHAVIRRYTGASELMDQLERRRRDVESLIRGVPGFLAYYALRSGDELVAVTVCDDRAGTEESTRRAASWVKENLPGVSVDPPAVSEGEVFLAFDG